MVEPLFPVPVGWQVTTVAEIAARGGGDVQTGPFGSQLHAADYVEQGIPSVMPQNIGDNAISEEGIARISVEDAKRLTRYRLRTGDIVYSRRGDVEKRSLVRPNNDGWLCGTGCLRIRFGEGHVLPEYAAYYLAHPAAKAWVVQHAVGATMPNLNTTILGSLPFVLPPMPEQISIARILGSLDDKIELNRRMNETLEAMAQAIFRDWFVDFGPTRRKLAGATDPLTIMGGLVQDAERAQVLADLFPAALGDDGLPEGWKKKALLEEARLISGGTPKTDRQDYWDGGIPWASAKDVSQCGEALLLGTERNITQSGLTNSSTKMVPKFSTVVVARGATTGRYCMFAEDMAMNQTCYALNSASGHPFLLYNMFGALIGELVQAAHGSVFDTITTKTLATGFVIDAQGVSAEFEKTAAPLYEAIENNSRQNRTLAATRDLLLPKLMSGEIRLSEAEDVMEAAQ